MFPFINGDFSSASNFSSETAKIEFLDEAPNNGQATPVANGNATVEHVSSPEEPCSTDDEEGGKVSSFINYIDDPVTFYVPSPKETARMWADWAKKQEDEDEARKRMAERRAERTKRLTGEENHNELTTVTASSDTSASGSTSSPTAGNTIHEGFDHLNPQENSVGGGDEEDSSVVIEEDTPKSAAP